MRRFASSWPCLSVAALISSSRSSAASISAMIASSSPSTLCWASSISLRKDVYSLLVLTSFSWRLYFPIWPLTSLTSVSRSRRFFWFWETLSLASATDLEPAWIFLSISWMSRGMVSRTGSSRGLGIQVLELDDQVEINVHSVSCLFLRLGLSVEWAYQDSNLGPAGYEPVALPLSYRPRPPFITNY